jgi:nitrite reductase/ring-hydroxylating ferredoxin subunit
MSEPQATAEQVAASSRAESPWHPLAGVDPATAAFPLRARCGSDLILVLRIGAGFRGVARVCPHQAAPLHDAILQGGDTMLRCRRHNYVFRLSDGKGINCPGYRLRVFDVKLENGALFARVAQ